MKADVKPLTRWAIYKGCKLRFRSRTPERVTGVLTDGGGHETAFEYMPQSLVLHVGGQHIRMDEYGSEVERPNEA